MYVGFFEKKKKHAKGNDFGTKAEQKQKIQRMTLHFNR